MSAEQKIAIGLLTAPEMVAQHDGLYPEERLQTFVATVRNRLVPKRIARETSYRIDFQLIAYENTMNAFALPGGQVFITYALFSKLNETRLAGVPGREIGHVIGRHSVECIAYSNFGKTVSMGA